MLSIHRFQCVAKNEFLGKKWKEFTFVNGKQFQKSTLQCTRNRPHSSSEKLELINPSNDVTQPRLMLPFLFTAAVQYSSNFKIRNLCIFLIYIFFQFTSSSFCLAAVWEYENMRSRALQLHRQTLGWVKKQFQRSNKQVHIKNYVCSFIVI